VTNGYYVNTAFGQAEYDFKMPKTVPNWIVGANIMDQRTVGAALLNGSPFHTYHRRPPKFRRRPWDGLYS